jgi:hypothetical protein
MILANQLGKEHISMDTSDQQTFPKSEVSRTPDQNGASRSSEQNRERTDQIRIEQIVIDSD